MSDSFDPEDYSLPGSSVHRILQARILEWVALFRVKALCDFSCTFAGVCVLTGLTHIHTPMQTHTYKHTYIYVWREREKVCVLPRVSPHVPSKRQLFV